jgi:hypothetical protein
MEDFIVQVDSLQRSIDPDRANVPEQANSCIPFYLLVWGCRGSISVPICADPFALTTNGHITMSGYLSRPPRTFTQSFWH